MIRVPFRTVVVGRDGLSLTSEDCCVVVGSDTPAGAATPLWLPSADCRGQILFLKRSHVGHGCVDVLALPGDQIEHIDRVDGFKLEAVGQHALIVADGSGLWHVANSTNLLVWLKRS